MHRVSITASGSAHLGYAKGMRSYILEYISPTSKRKKKTSADDPAPSGNPQIMAPSRVAEAATPASTPKKQSKGTWIKKTGVGQPTPV